MYKMGYSPALMEDKGTVKPIPTTEPQKQDMGKMKIRPMEKRGYSDQAFGYKY